MTALILVLVTWEVYWTYHACWAASRRNEKKWFLFFLVLICSVFLRCFTCGDCAESRLSEGSGLLASASYTVICLSAVSCRSSQCLFTSSQRIRAYCVSQNNNPRTVAATAMTAAGRLRPMCS